MKIHEEDKEALYSLTAEIKSIHNQSIILHGERIKKAQEILKKYVEMLLLPAKKAMIIQKS